ncbi:hypothetical protein GC174_10595 [bacterium]|nr:hypothetical protein [bacterium]
MDQYQLIQLVFAIPAAGTAVLALMAILFLLKKLISHWQQFSLAAAGIFVSLIAAFTGISHGTTFKLTATSVALTIIIATFLSLCLSLSISTELRKKRIFRWFFIPYTVYSSLVVFIAICLNFVS